MDHVDLGDSVMYESRRCCGGIGVAEAQGVAVQSGDQIAVQTLRSIIDGTPGVVPLGQHYTYGYKGMYPTFFKDFKQSIEKACGGKVELGAGMPQMYRLTGDHQTFEECRGALFDDIGDFADPQITVYTGESHF